MLCLAVTASPARLGAPTGDSRLEIPTIAVFIEALGLNGAVVANKDLEKGQKRKIEYGDEIRIGEFSLYMMEPSVRRVSGKRAAMSPRRQVIELEQKLHHHMASPNL